MGVVKELMWDISLFPDSASTMAGEVDRLTLTLTLFSLVFAIPVAAQIVYFAIKYRRGSKVDRTGALPTSLRLETAWIVVPLFLALGIFTWSVGPYVRMYSMPAEGLDVYVVGLQWMWQFEHSTGQREINELHVPVGRKVRLTMISQDVIHSFYVPDFRIKRDVIPGRYTTVWFEATKPGSFHLFCAEYCGTEHSGMVGQVVVLEPRQYQDWLSQSPLEGQQPIPEAQGMGSEATAPTSLANAGEALFQTAGCSTCHRMEGNGAGPSLSGIWGHEQELATGETVLVDADYVRRSIIEPNAQVVAGYTPIMPSYAGQLTEEELLRLVEYIRSLGEPGDQTETTEPGPNQPDTGAPTVEATEPLRGDNPDAADLPPSGSTPVAGDATPANEP
jgi:cytochrome c oxidase subunit II